VSDRGLTPDEAEEVARMLLTYAASPESARRGETEKAISLAQKVLSLSRSKEG